MGSHWGLRVAPIHMLALTVGLSLAALTALLGLTLFRSGTPSHRAVIEILEFLQFSLVVFWGVFLAKRPRLFPALNALREDADWTTDATGVRLWMALAFEAVALVAALWAALALLLFTRFDGGYATHPGGDVVVADLLGIEATPLFSGPTGVVALWIGLLAYLVGFVLR